MKRDLQKLILMLVIICMIKSLTAQIFSAGYHHSLFLCNDGKAMASGSNYHGQLGFGSFSNNSSYILTPVNGITNIVAVAAGAQHSLFLKGDGTVWAVGHNQYGQLGNGTQSDMATPTQIASLSGIIAIAASESGSLFLKSDGTVWACGYNFYGEIGDGTTIDRHTPVQVSSVTGVVAISQGSHYSLFLKNDGTVWACGRNTNGKLGDGTTIDRHTPIQISSLLGITAISAGSVHSLFLKSDSTVWACGENTLGSLGDGTTTNRYTPIQINSLSSIIAIAASTHSIFLKNDGTVLGCGLNFNGQFGNGQSSTTPDLIPVSSTISDVAAISTNNEHSLFLKSDSTIWFAGYDISGQVGNGTAFYQYNSPTQVSGLCGLTTTVEQSVERNLISIFPNPANGLLKIRIPITIADKTYIFSDETGRQVLTGKLDNQSSSIDVSHLNAGIYFVRIGDQIKRVVLY